MDDPKMVRETAPKYGEGRRLLTYEDYCLMPAGVRYELLEGVLRMAPSPNTFHQDVSKRLERLLVERLEDQGRGRVYSARTSSSSPRTVRGSSARLTCKALPT